MTHVVVYVCLMLSSVAFASLLVLLVKQIIEYRRTSACLQMRREEIRRTRLFRLSFLHQGENWRKSRRSIRQEKECDK